jgi:hypothetical protein
MKARRGPLVLLFGGVAVSVLVEPVGQARLFWLSVVLGLTYLAAAAVTGRASPLWSAGLVLSSWSLAVALVLTRTVAVDFTGAAITGLGIGAVLATTLVNRGVLTARADTGVPLLLVGLL